MKLIAVPAYNDVIAGMANSSRGVWQIDGYPLVVCRPFSFDMVRINSGLVQRLAHWVVIADTTKDSDITISQWLTSHQLGLPYPYPTRARALDVLQMALADDPYFFAGIA